MKTITSKELRQNYGKFVKYSDKRLKDDKKRKLEKFNKNEKEMEKLEKSSD